MKRDMELVRKILECVEDEQPIISNQPLRETNSSHEIYWHLRLCYDMELISLMFHEDADYGVSASHNALDLRYRLTWKGHDFLDELRAKDSPPEIGGTPDIEPVLDIPQRGSTMLPHEVDQSGICRHCEKQVLGPEKKEVCRGRRTKHASLITGIES